VIHKKGHAITLSSHSLDVDVWIGRRARCWKSFLEVIEHLSLFNSQIGGVLWFLIVCCVSSDVCLSLEALTFFLYIGRFWFRCFYICQWVETPPGISDGVFVCAFGYYLLRRIAQRWLFRRNLPHYIWVRPRSPSVIPPQDCEAAADINNHEGFYCRRTKGKINIRVNISRHGVCCAQTQVITHSRRNICHCACGKYHKRRCKIQLVPRNLSMGDFIVPLFR